MIGQWCRSIFYTVLGQASSPEIRLRHQVLKFKSISALIFLWIHFRFFTVSMDLFKISLKRFFIYSYTVNFGIHGIRQAIKYGESSILIRLHDKREFNWLIDISPAGTHEETMQVLEASVDDDPIQGYTKLPGIHFPLSTVIWFDSSKTSELSRAKYAHFMLFHYLLNGNLCGQKTIESDSYYSWPSLNHECWQH